MEWKKAIAEKPDVEVRLSPAMIDALNCEPASLIIIIIISSIMIANSHRHLAVGCCIRTTCTSFMPDPAFNSR